MANLPDKKQLVLYAENDSDDAFFMQRAFVRVKAPLELKIVVDGQKAVEYLERAHGDGASSGDGLPQFIVLDLKMPQMSGLQVLVWVRRQGYLASIPVIMLTTSAESTDLERCRSAGADAYIVKPSGSSDLVETVRGIVKASEVDSVPERRERIRSMTGNQFNAQERE